jgi:hypothetical protein
MPTYVAPDGTTFEAADLIDGVPINPKLPADFDDTPNDARPPSHWMWWRVPYVVFDPAGAQTVTAGASAPAIDVRCLDGGGWDRSTWLGTFASIDDAIAFIRNKRIRTFFARLVDVAPPVGR